MKAWSRRAFLTGAATSSLSACVVNTNDTEKFSIDDKVAETVRQMHSELPFALDW